SWLLKPKMVGGNLRLWSPGIKLGVKPNSFFHRTECFGPVLGLMRADNLDHAIELANAPEFGLTSGLHSLDRREIKRWRDKIQAGNLYINRHITGAIVQRQPFGGWKASSVGPGGKAGGPNYVLQLGRWWQVTTPKNQAEVSNEVNVVLQRCLAMIKDDASLEQLDAAARNYAWAWQAHYGQEHDPSQILGEANDFRYRPCPMVLVRANGEADAVDVCKIALAAHTCGTPLTISLPLTATQWTWWGSANDIHVILEDEAAFIQRIQQAKVDTRLRSPQSVSADIRRAANEVNMAVIEELVLSNGRLELRYYLREQAISYTYHRYGNIITPPKGEVR
ncbi:MAG: aldehyde dehydrogenase family protein, partial [Anaerolineae bacterium]|nr:aldehyde dehydrogenase family protein [Anaerolineae bacterium]